MTIACRVSADTHALAKSLEPLHGLHGVYYNLKFDIVLLFGLTELKAEIRWKHKVRQESPFRIMTDQLA